MRCLRRINLNIIIVIVTLSGVHANAEQRSGTIWPEHTSIVIAEGSTTPVLSIRLEKKMSGEVTFNLLGGYSFIDKSLTTTAISSAGVVSLPSIVAADAEKEGSLTISGAGHQKPLTVRVFTARRDVFPMFEESASLFSSALLMFGEDFAVIADDMINDSISNALARTPAISRQSSATALTSNDTGSTTSFFDDGSIIYTRSICFRPFIPFTRNGSGQVVWQISSPRVLHTLKDENVSSNASSSLRCPRKTGPGTMDYYIDGIYSLTWRTLSGVFQPFKVPDHCTAYRFSGRVDCCCNAAMSAVYGGCRFIDPRPLPDWPDVPRICTLSEP